MACNQHPFWTHDTVAAAVLAGVGAASLQIKLDALASELNIPMLTACIHAWPMALIVAGLVLLLVHSGAREPKTHVWESQAMENSDRAPLGGSGSRIKGEPRFEMRHPFGPRRMTPYLVQEKKTLRTEALGSARARSASRVETEPVPLPQTAQEWDEGVIPLERELQRQLDLAVGGTEV